MSIDRDTHFVGFAKLLIHDLATTHDEIGYRSAEDTIKLIAQRAYDLVTHVLINTSGGLLDELNYELAVKSIPPPLDGVPDLTEWPVKPDEN